MCVLWVGARVDRQVSDADAEVQRAEGHQATKERATGHLQGHRPTYSYYSYHLLTYLIYLPPFREIPASLFSPLIYFIHILKYKQIFYITYNLKIEILYF